MAAGGLRCQGGLRQVRDPAYFFLMSKADEERAKRLAEALRQNLRRRKAQARGESEAPPPPACPED
jgi:hypothetical protein